MASTVFSKPHRVHFIVITILSIKTLLVIIPEKPVLPGLVSKRQPPRIPHKEMDGIGDTFSGFVGSAFYFTQFSHIHIRLLENIFGLNPSRYS
jgi:hypothetical protein